MLRVLLTALFLILPTYAPAAEITRAPHLLERLNGLTPAYPSPFRAVPGLTHRERLFVAQVLNDDGKFVFDTSDKDRPVKVIHVKGPTVKGDTERLRAELTNGVDGYRTLIVLEGPGGSFDEGLKMGKLIHESIFFRQDEGLAGVYVLNGSQCASACALAAAWAGKFLHVEHGAKLGFHLPFFGGAKGEIERPVKEILNIAYDIAFAYNELLLENLVHPDIFREIYKHRTSDSFLVLDTAERAARYGFHGMVGPDRGAAVHIEGIGLDLVTALCTRAFEQEQSPKNFSDYEYAVPWFPANLTLGELIRTSGAATFIGGAEVEFTDMRCHFGADKAGRLHLGVSRSDARCQGAMIEGSGGICPAAAPEVFHPVSRHWMIETLGCGQDRLSVEPKMEVTRDVNLRDRPSTKGGTAGRLKSGQKVRVSACRITDDKQTVRYQLTAGGRTGWASARCLEPDRD